MSAARDSTSPPPRPAPVTREWTRVVTGLRRPIVLSPHLDDAVLSVPGFLLAHPGATVLTVFSASDPAALPSPWDQRCGLAASADPMCVRREEDQAALRRLGVRGRYLGEVDGGYHPDGGQQRDVTAVAARLESALDELAPSAVAVPMGLLHPDHITTHDAALLVAARRDAWSWFCYEDHPYRFVPGALAWRVGELLRNGLTPTPAAMPRRVDPRRTAAAVSCYRSQLAALEEDWGLAGLRGAGVGETWWRLHRNDSGG